MKHILEQVFKVEPVSWGLRGDPYMFELLGKEMVRQSLSITKDNFLDILDTKFNEIVLNKGAVINSSKSNVYFDNFPQDGMSGGYISLTWWIDVGIPHIEHMFKNFIEQYSE